MIRLRSTRTLCRLRAELAWARIREDALTEQRDRLAAQVTDAYVARSVGDDASHAHALARAADTVRRIHAYDDLQRASTTP